MSASTSISTVIPNGTPRPDAWSRGTLQLSVVIPFHNEAANIGPLLDELVWALTARLRFEVVCIDDGSADDTTAMLLEAAHRYPEIVVLTHARRAGQSTAIRNAVKAARAPWIATLDGDRQNDPADIPLLLDALRTGTPDTKLVGGWRVHRKDGWNKRMGSRVANAIRSWLLRDSSADSGCGIKLFDREAFLDLPYFDHMHRYLPALMQRAGWQTLSVPVNHRPRASGVSKYNNLGRLWVGMSDLCGVAWLIRRSAVVEVEIAVPARIAADDVHPHAEHRARG